MDVRKACLDMLVYTSSTEESKGNRGKELLRAGSVDALIVLATQSVKNDFLYQEAFMATYRTFITTHDLLDKLVQRFRKFNNRRDDRAQQQMAYKRVAHCAFSLMVRLHWNDFFMSLLLFWTFLVRFSGPPAPSCQKE